MRSAAAACIGRRRCCRSRRRYGSVFTPHVWYSARADGRGRCPAGGVHWPKPLLPQQTMVPSVFTPHVCAPPALTETKTPAGGLAGRSCVAPADYGAAGLHTARVPSTRADRGEGASGGLGLVAPAGDGVVGPYAARMAQPALTWVKVPAGGVARWNWLSPQQATVPSAFTPHVCSHPR